MEKEAEEDAAEKLNGRVTGCVARPLGKGTAAIAATAQVEAAALALVAAAAADVPVRRAC